MKTLSTLIASFALVVSLVSIAAAGVMNPSIQYRIDLAHNNANVAATEQPVAWQHLNRFARDNAEKGSLGGTFIQTTEEQQVPKNYKNNL